MKFQDRLKEMDACPDAVKWVNGRGLQRAFKECKRADWMLWVFAKMIGKPGWPTHQEIVLVACWCARQAQTHWTDKKDKRPIKAIEAAEKWEKNPTEENKDAARAAAYAAYAAAYAARAADAADAAARAAAHAAARAAYAAAYAAAHKKMCDHIRETLKPGKF